MNLSLLYNEPGPNAGPDDLDTLDQVREVGRALEGLGHCTEDLAVPGDLEAFRRIIRGKGDRLFFNLTDPRMGEGRLIALPVLALEQEGRPYTGCSADALYLTSNKPLAKELMTLAGIPTPPWFTHREGRPGGDFEPGLYIVKSVWEHGSAGMTPDSVFHAPSLGEGTARLAREEGDVFAEAFLPGREINLGLVSDGKSGWEILPPSEIVYTDRENLKPFLDYRSKWDEASRAYASSARSLDFPEEDRPLIGELNRIALRCAALFGLNGYARVDFRLDGEGRPMVLEVNANPCLTPGAGFAAAAERAGIGYGELIGRIASTPAGRRRRNV